jgi:hypothetical protein
MRKTLAVVLGLALLGLAAPPVFAQAPATPVPTPVPPSAKVTITGFLDNVTNANQNSSEVDQDITQQSEDEWYGRTRGRFEITGEVGRTKGVLAIELDLTYGQAGCADNSTQSSINLKPPSSCGTTTQTTRTSTSGGFDADTDVLNVIEWRWMYVDFPLMGPGSLMPFIPLASNAVIGAQPYTVTYKPFSFAASDFSGATVNMNFLPNLKGQFIFAQFEEESRGVTFGYKAEDWGIVTAVEISPFKGLDIKPIYGYQQNMGTTSGNIRRGTGGIANNQTNYNDHAQENRHTIGIDARWQAGPLRIAPTFFYQFGNVDIANAGTGSGAGSCGSSVFCESDISAFFFDLEVGFRLGPLLLEGRGMYASGNDSSDNLRKDINYYQQFQQGNAYWSGWNEALNGNIDYLTTLYPFSTALNSAANIGYDRYGRAMLALKATYNLTPAFSVYGIVNPMWTAEEPNTRSCAGGGTVTGPTSGRSYSCAAANGLTDGAGGRKEDGSYLGTGFTLGLTYRIAQGLTFDMAGGYLKTGDAYNICRSGSSLGACLDGAGVDPATAKDVQSVAARVRFVY